jgi:hypothetical protein
VNPRAYHLCVATWAVESARKRLDVRTEPDPPSNERDPSTILFIERMLRSVEWLGGVWTGEALDDR